MSITKSIGGNRLGSGNKMNVDLKTYNRSNHNLDTVIKTTMSAGTLVPFLSIIGLPGDTIDIDLDCKIYTHPTVGPLFGSYKVQLDVFTVPVRLYVPKLHNDPLKAGLKMSNIKLPQIELIANEVTGTEDDIDNSQINPSCIFKYLGISGLGRGTTPGETYALRRFNAIPYLGYWDIYKNFYANKQEEIGAVVHNSITRSAQTIDTVIIYSEGSALDTLPEAPTELPITPDQTTASIEIAYTGTMPTPNQIIIKTTAGEYLLTDMFVNIDTVGTEIVATGAKYNTTYLSWRYASANDLNDDAPQVYTFPLDNIDTMRNQLLADVMNPNAYIILPTDLKPYGLAMEWTDTAGTENARYSKMISQEGLALKTYQSDMFNNWIQTEWIDGTNGISQMTAVSTTGDKFTIDALTLAKDLWILLNRVAISDGSYKSWIESVYTKGGYWRAETPSYEGGLSKELIFEEVISNSASTGETKQPLGTLAGRGVMSNKHKGGKIVIKPDEIVQIMGIISLTPRIDYTQGNTFDVNLKTMDDFHKPQLDGIGYQDLITDAMAWWDSVINGTTGAMTYKSAGKQPAWMNYMSNVNRNYGNFAVQNNEMFMTLARRYEYDTGGIKDLTTYIDPAKYNYIFAETARDAQNFWVQIGADIKARRVMSAKIIPNL